MIELIIVMAVWLVATEFIFFKWIRNLEDDEHEVMGFIPSKLLSIFAGLLATFILFGIPWLFSTLPGPGGETPVGDIVYLWYYGILFGLTALFGINYAIHKWLQNRK